MRKELELHLVQLKQLPVLPPIERGVGQQELRRATLDNGPQQFGRCEVVDRLRRKQHDGVTLSPGLEPFLDVRP